MAALAGLFRHAGEAFTSPSRVGTKKARSPQQPGSEERARTAPRPRVAVDEGGGDEAVGAAGPAAAAAAERGSADEVRRFAFCGSALPPSPEAIEALVAMGFDRDSALQALAEGHNDVNVATHLLLSGGRM
eukprot:gene3312-4169_t